MASAKAAKAVIAFSVAPPQSMSSSVARELQVPSAAVGAELLTGFVGAVYLVGRGGPKARELMA
jgi:hypothetical protein